MYPNQIPVPETYTPYDPEKQKLIQASVFAIPICFLVIFFLFVYFISRRLYTTYDNWYSLEITFTPGNNNLSTAELGLSKDVREMLPILIFNKSFSIKDLQCSVCLGDYQADEKLQQIPGCGHTFHMECIDLWLSSHSTCPLSRLSLIPKASLDRSHQSLEIVSSIDNSSGGVSGQLESQLTSEAASHINEGNRNNGRENDRDSIGTIG